METAPKTSSVRIRRYMAIIAAVLLVCAVLFASRVRDRHDSEVVLPEAISLGVPREPLCALVILAAERGFFAEEGVDAKIEDEYPSGKRALRGLLDGEVEMTCTAEVPIVFSSFERNDLRIIATVGTCDDEPRIIARTDRGISTPTDFQGKRIATQRASAVHYFLHVFLLRHQLAERDVQISFLKAEELPGAFDRGDIDAFSMREPFISEAQELLDGKATVFAAPGLYIKMFNLICLHEVAVSKPEAIRRVLRALLRAEKFARDDTQRAIQIVAEKLGIPNEELTSLWPSIWLRVSLGQELVEALDDEARWALDSQLTEAVEPPNYTEFVDVSFLHAIKPTAVTVVR